MENHNFFPTSIPRPRPIKGEGEKGEKKVEILREKKGGGRT